MATPGTWSDVQDDALRSMMAEGLSLAAIAEKLGKTRQAISNRINYCCIRSDGSTDAAERERRHIARREQIRQWRARNPGRAQGNRPRARLAEPSPSAAEPDLPPADTRDLTALLCGDPLPGRSALDRRRA